MRKETARRKYKDIWYLREFDFRPMPLMWNPQLYSIKQEYLKEKSAKFFDNLEDAVNASYEIRKLLKIEKADDVLNILKDTERYKEAWGIL